LPAARHLTTPGTHNHPEGDVDRRAVTAQYAPAGTDPKTSCVYLVSISPDLTLWAQYINTSGDLPGLNHRVACTNAQSAAVDMLNTYRLCYRTRPGTWCPTLQYGLAAVD
jgi:hypothetical protein